MKSLCSNGRMSMTHTEWCGVDASDISYPAVSTCVTVTCIAGDKLVGCHLFYLNTNDVTAADLKTFGDMAKNEGTVKWVSVVGMLDNWKTTTAKNRTGYAMNNGTLLKKVREVLGYVGAFAVYDASSLGEIDILAQKTKGQYIQYSYTKGSGGPTFISHSDMSVEI